MKEILVAGIGDILRGDDGFGVEVVRRLALAGSLAGRAKVVDFGIRGFDLAAALAGRPAVAILVDVTARGGVPGTLYVIEPDAIDEPAMPEAHGLHPVQALALARSLGGLPDVLRLVGCEPATFGDDIIPLMGLSPAVEAALDAAVDLVVSLVGELGAKSDA